jgi:hypothetical protein
MDGAFARLFSGSAHGLPINRDHALRHSDQRRDPGNETALELLRVEGGEDIAEVVMRRRAGEKRQETAEEFALLAAEPGDIDEGFGSRQHREERQQQYLIERIHHLAALAMVGQII